MKNNTRSILLMLLSAILLSGCTAQSIWDVITGATLGRYAKSNDFFSEAPTQKLKGSFTIEVSGELKKSDTLDIRTKYLRTVTSREVSVSDTSFIGAFRYDGYSLCDILADFTQDKASKKEFYPTVDLYVEVYNDRGDMARFSWGEIFYSATPHSIIIAIQSTRVIPGKTEDVWVTSDQIKLVASTDAFNSRYILNPTKIVVKSVDVLYPIDRTITSYRGPIRMVGNDGNLLQTVNEIPQELQNIRYETNTYGHGMGPKGYKIYEGKPLRYFLLNQFAPTAERLQNGLFVIAAADGYRATFSYAELMSRIDGNLSLIRKTSKGFTIFIPADFFVDRQIKTVSEIRLFD